ncbi:Globin/Protoglobin domain-containing protein [Dioscorea alata]|uniref:Globin/Protoglobin domain-containing protein n=1 Tax=Dioscorea alata TaxID=55571 RepID=A0ACB7UYI0_DIOAL|nr:Globin/Protoglobin domain-containing protein [Dioscorea alata]
MVDNTRIKDLQSKMETLFRMVDQNQKHSQEQIQGIEQTLAGVVNSVANLSRLVESQVKVASASSTDQFQQLTLPVGPDLNPIIALPPRSVRLDFPHFDRKDVLQ